MGREVALEVESKGANSAGVRGPCLQGAISNRTNNTSI
jgi:hypothetical protein